jgi:hypothetical protein
MTTVKVQQKSEKAMEGTHGCKFDDDSQRVAYLFEAYQTLSGELFKDERERGCIHS